MKNAICVIQPFDPRGQKIGGIESHMRELIRSCPPDLSIVMIGIDEVGDLRIGELQTTTFEGRAFEMMPLLRRTGDEHLLAAKKIWQSLTLQFFFAFLRYLSRVRKALKRRACSLEIQRFEYATFGKLLGRPTIQVVHGESRQDQPMDSLLKKFWFTNVLNEKIAIKASTRLIGVNPRIVENIVKRFPETAAKATMMTVSVNTDVFKLAPTYPPTEPFRIVFAGRLDAFKRPDLMFRVVDRLRRAHGLAVEFHYIGGSDPEKFPEFASIRDVYKPHGMRKADAIAAIFAEMHAGIVVSEFEGMPVYMLELTAVGRPIVCLELPQYKILIKDDVSGLIVPRGADDEANVVAVVEGFVRLKTLMDEGRLSPTGVRECVMPFSSGTQMTKLYDLHRAALCEDAAAHAA